jgi:hypothetical protein
MTTRSFVRLLLCQMGSGEGLWGSTRVARGFAARLGHNAYDTIRRNMAVFLAYRAPHLRMTLR